jgi:hypothetical protein
LISFTTLCSPLTDSQNFTETSELFAIRKPLAIVAGFSNNAVGGTIVAPTERSQALYTIKRDFLNLIHQADVVADGKSIEQCQPFINIARHFQLISEMSVNDLATLGHSIGFSPTLDNPKCAKYQASCAAVNGGSGNGYNNNRVFASSVDNQSVAGAQNTYLAVGNAASQDKIGRYVDLTNTGGQGIYGATNTLMTGTQLNNEFRPYYTTSGNYMYWHDYAVIKLNYLFESLNKIGLVKHLDAQPRLWVNTETVNVTVGKPATVDTAYTLITPANNTFSNTCPILVNHLAGSSGIVPANTAQIAAGFYIARPPATSFEGINLAASIVQHPLQNCRLYYSQVTVDPQKSFDCVQRNRNKKR